MQEKHLFHGLQFPDGPLLMSMYADDILLFVRHPTDNLHPVIEELGRFGAMSGLMINWDKSVLFPFTAAALVDETEHLLRRAGDTTKYLGVHLHRDKEQVICLNYGPAVEQLTTQVERWPIYGRPHSSN